MTNFKIGITKSDSPYISTEKTSENLIEYRNDVNFIVNYFIENMLLFREAKEKAGSSIFYDGVCSGFDMSVKTVTINDVALIDSYELDKEIGWIGLRKS